MPNQNQTVNQKINWKLYNKNLSKRATIFSFLPKNIEDIWYNQHLSGKKGAPKIYSDEAIIICLTAAEIYQLPLRQIEGFLNDLFIRLKLCIRSPNYTVLSRRRMKLNVAIQIYGFMPRDSLLVDSTGMKVSGDGEWHEQYHETNNRKSWLKVHCGTAYTTQQILSSVFTLPNITDGQALPEVLTKIPKKILQTLTECIGDGAYDNKPCYTITQKYNMKSVFPIRSGAVIHEEDIILRPRNEAIMRIYTLGDEKLWKKEIGYHKRSLAETVFFRLKTIFGPYVTAKKFTSQTAQMNIRINLLNKYMFQNTHFC